MPTAGPVRRVTSYEEREAAALKYALEVDVFPFHYFFLKEQTAHEIHWQGHTVHQLPWQQGKEGPFPPAGRICRFS